MVNNNLPKVILTDEDKAISQAIQNVFGANWYNFTKAFYEYIKEYEVDNFIIKWQQLQIDFLDSDITSIQREESINSLMKNYINATNSLLDFLKVFESALEQHDIDLQLFKYRQNQFNVILKIISPFKYQAVEILISYAFRSKYYKHLIILV
ncbi:7321_t:CDS:2 [Funneliformis caledonium]|uniref:7321_t:CDS:1 n=1 Tax=Funneliformis caledonium TaxID=1117310 RepID=A0A9N9ESY5_9GLOM|nr:7321_t:CDS:2 [Funneliformis caledonium]